ncbi:hypothetical protein AB0F11_28160 [Streptomyces sp. NPDC032472]|uniref:hypothetical protein n=1 Tax=Streptomyces sp. NPDC032472 TaxID=3155018 RepID=UPI0033C733B9
MTDPAPHDVSLAYAETSLGDVAAGGFTTTPDPGGNSTTLSGTCPRCAGATVTVYRYGMPGLGTKGLRSWLGGARSRSAESEGPLRSEVHFCECGHAHPGLPAEAVFIGCGASWRIGAAP